MSNAAIALVGDRNEEVTAHRAIPLALAMAASDVGCAIEFQWVGTETLGENVSNSLSSFTGIWCIPASPYKNQLGALSAIRFARERRVPFLGTCGGFQHAILEFARNALGHAEADSIEDNPDTTLPLIAPMVCALRDGKKGEVSLLPTSRIATIYGSTSIAEKYNCGFGFNGKYLSLFDDSALQIVGHDKDGDVRVIDIQEHPFFTGVAFQPERSALEEKTHPLINAFVTAAVNYCR